MNKKRQKRKPAYKQMAFETAVRNPERYLGLLHTIQGFENRNLDDACLLEIVSHLYLNKIVGSSQIEIDDDTVINDIKEQVKQVNSTRKADGGFPAGYASRFWTYMRTPSELGFVYAQYNEPLRFSYIAKKLIAKEIDEQEAFSIQAIKYNRKNPYRNVTNDFNFFRFILEVLLELNKKGKSLSYEQFIIAMFSRNGDVKNFLNLLKNNTFKNFDTAYNFVKKEYLVNTKYETITQWYPDVVRRLFILSGFISIRFSGKKLIQLNKNKLKYIQQLLKFDFTLSQVEKTDAKKYFERLDTQNAALINLINQFRKEDIIDGDEYVNKILDIINTHNITEHIILEGIKKIGSKSNIIDEFKEIPEPLKLEFYISILIALKYGKQFAIRPNYKADHIGKPYSHAPGNTGDIEVFSKKIYWLIEVTLVRNRTQQLNHETTSVVRHLYNNKEFKDYLKKYLSFVAPTVHQDTKEFYDFTVVKNSMNNEYLLHLKPYQVDEFVDVTVEKRNFEDMEHYTNATFQDFKNKLCN